LVRHQVVAYMFAQSWSLVLNHGVGTRMNACLGDICGRVRRRGWDQAGPCSACSCLMPDHMHSCLCMQAPVSVRQSPWRRPWPDMFCQVNITHKGRLWSTRSAWGALRKFSMPISPDTSFCHARRCTWLTTFHNSLLLILGRTEGFALLATDVRNNAADLKAAAGGIAKQRI
jgi:hypothetical protein